jgi:glyoxylase-like metal-dependent hydrolase (beta-lactamase superfamily II)
VIRVERQGDVIRLEMTRTPNRIVGINVSAFVVRGVLIDSGFPAIGGELGAYLAQSMPRGAFITHSHEDHAGNVDRLARLGVPLRIDDATLTVARSRQTLALYRRITWGTPTPLVTDVVPFSDPDLHFIATPGHSDDHHVVWDAQTGTLFSGDLFLGVKAAVIHAHERPHELVRSLREMIALGPERMFDAHRGLVKGPGRALEAKVAWLEGAIGRVSDLVARGWDDVAIQHAVIGRGGAVDVVSRGEYSKRNFIAAVRRDATRGPTTPAAG